MLLEKKTKRLIDIYSSAKAWKIIYKLIIPSILVALPAGIFVFVDQILMVNLIPKNHYFFSDRLFGISSEKIDEFKSLSLKFYTASDVVKSAVALSLPLTLLFDILPFLISIGAMTIYAKRLAAKKINELSSIFNSAFWFSLMLSIIFFLLIFLLSSPIIGLMSSPEKPEKPISVGQGDTAIYKEYNEYLEKYNVLTIQYASQYLKILSISLIFSMILSTLNMLLRVESRAAITVFSAIFGNVLNILLDYIFLSMTKLGMSAAALATIVGYFSSTTILFLYLIYAGKRNLLHFKINDIKINKTINFKLFWSMVWISLPVFVVSLLYSVNVSIFLPVFGDTVNSISNNYFYYQGLFGGTQPIATLIFAGSSGIFDGVRGIISFSFESSTTKDKRIRMLFNLTAIVAVVYCFFMFLLTYLLRYQFYYILGNNAASEDFFRVLLIVIAELPAFSLSIPVFAYFQASNRNVTAIIISFVQTLVFIVVLFVLRAICLSESYKENAKNLSMLMLMTLWIASFINSILLYLYGAGYVFFVDPKSKFKWVKVNT